MAALPQFSYIFGLGVCFAFLDAWNIGANDVANSFATSVASRSLTMIQAMTIAAVMEFLGAVLAGQRVGGTVKSGIVSTDSYTDAPSVLMLAMLCALIGSSLFLTLATKIGAPVSTTHCIIGGIIGAGMASLGANGVDWSWEGVSQVFAAWGIAPCVSAAFAALLYLTTKYTTFARSTPEKQLRTAMVMVPIFYAVTTGILTMLVVWKGAASLDLDNFSDGQTVGTIFGVAGGCALLSCIFILPYAHVKLTREDWKLKQWEIIKGPLLLRRPDAGPIPEGMRLVPDYYAGHYTKEQLAAQTSTTSAASGASSDEESSREEGADEKGNLYGRQASVVAATPAVADAPPPAPVQRKWYEPIEILSRAKYFFFRGVAMDIASEQSNADKSKALTRLLVGNNLQHKHAIVEHHDLKVEHLYSFLQVMTAATAAFGHGANDVANAMGPLAAIYQIWQEDIADSSSDVPIWILVFGGAAITIGLWTYGYNLMRNLGNRITLHSPSRGFCMELGAAIAVVMATRLSLPVSTSQCIIGATVGVGLCAGDYKAINWRMVVWSYMGWILTLPCTAVISGCIMAFALNSPSWAAPYNGGSPAT
ncbi:hypothetical protein MBLNU230_g0738t1 [Neophaeotheca triangularis]